MTSKLPAKSSNVFDPLFLDLSGILGRGEQYLSPWCLPSHPTDLNPRFSYELNGHL